MTKQELASVPLRATVDFLYDGHTVKRGYVLSNGASGPDTRDPGAFLTLAVFGYSCAIQATPEQVIRVVASK
jgi:hypothetical protein